MKDKLLSVIEALINDDRFMLDKSSIRYRKYAKFPRSFMHSLWKIFSYQSYFDNNFTMKISFYTHKFDILINYEKIEHNWKYPTYQYYIECGELIFELESYEVEQLYDKIERKCFYLDRIKQEQLETELQELFTLYNIK